MPESQLGVHECDQCHVHDYGGVRKSASHGCGLLGMTKKCQDRVLAGKPDIQFALATTRRSPLIKPVAARKLKISCLVLF
ncbi:hypothetical protein, partial [Diaphorobacter sp.]|uniref:hypothetical protein n=1 Tax=Diaphorobacter sp. TaxID=1934310 RepID=UPI003D0EA035